MAKKKENTLQYLQMPLPQGRKSTRMTKVAFGGLNKRYNIDSGDLSMESNISTNEYPYLTPSHSRILHISGYSDAIGMFAFDNFLIVVYEENDTVKLDYITEEDGTYTGIVGQSGDNSQRSIVQFNVYDTPTDPLTGQYVKKLLIFPDKYSMYMRIVKSESNPANWEGDYAEADDKADTELSRADLGVMYEYEGKFYTVTFAVKTEDDEGYDENKISYKRVVNTKHEYTKLDEDGEETTVTAPTNHFFCDGMEASVKEYRNETPETDESGAEIYPPPDTANRNCYYRNSYNNDVYRWCEYETEDGGTAQGWKVSVPPAVPSLKYVTVHLSRVFGVDDDRVYASGFNDYTNWNLDTVNEYNESNAWCSPSQSNTKAGGSFTGITTFDSHVVCFKRDFMHEIYNTKNPFRLQDIYAEGCIDNRTIQDVDGKLIFVSEDDVKIYTGSNPRIIGYNLNMSQFTYAVSGTDNRNYYLYCEDNRGNTYLYVYDTFSELWSEQNIDHKVLSFAHNKHGMYMLCDNGVVYKMDTTSYNHDWSFETELITNKTVNIKHIKKLQMLVDIDTDAEMKVYILYDDEKFDKKTSHLVYSSKRSGRVPIRVKPRKTANYGFKLHIDGYGYVKIYELEIFVEAGGELYV